MVTKAARIIFEAVAKDDPGLGTWEDHVARCRQKRYRGNWREMVPDDPRPDSYDFLTGEDREIVERVAAVVSAATIPPPE